MLARASILLVITGLRAQRVARMVVDHGERMAAPARQREVALEIHLPELVGFGAFEPLPGAGMFAGVLLQLAVPAQDLGNRARRRHRGGAFTRHHMRDLAPAPGVVALVSNNQHPGFNRRHRPRRAAMWPARAVSKALAPLLQIAPQPFVAVAARDAKPPAQLAQIHRWR
jgi:hypothetical protein